MQNRLEVKLPLAPVVKRKDKQKKDKESESVKNLLTHSKDSSTYRPPSSVTEKIAINCEITKNKTSKNPLTQSLKTSKSLKLFNFDNDPINDYDENTEIFNNVVQQQKEEQYFQVEKFLKEINMKDLFDVFIQHKIYDLDKINTLKDKDLLKMKITEKKREKILEHIKNIQERKFTTGHGEMSTQCENNSNQIDKDILDVEENERIQSELFKKAVEEFRRAGQKNLKENINNNGIDTSVTTNNTNEPEVIISNPKKFLMEIGGSELFNLNSLSLFADQGNDVKDDVEYLPELAIGKACWNCYKLIYEAYPLNLDKKFFCSEKCLNAYKKINEIKCNFCGKLFFKNNGLVNKNNFLCSPDCYLKDKNKIEENEDEEEDETTLNNNNKINNQFTYQDNENDVKEEIIDILDI